MSVDWTRPIQTRSGRKARLVCTIPPVGGAETRVVTLDEQSLRLYYEAGNYILGAIENDDIINVPLRKVTREIEAWAVVDGGDSELMLVTFNKGVADRNAGAFLVVRLTGTYEVEVEE